ncbi:MAG: VCBS repeat-containing protein [Verrucomicrobia bacterium]|nr:VCBS repeat-containing protein [Verrucomicrobiota bacterium]
MRSKTNCWKRLYCGIIPVALLFASHAYGVTNAVPQAFEVYGGTIGTIDAIQVPGDTNKTRVFASTDSANSVFYADVDHTSATPFGTNFVFTVLPDMDASSNLGAPEWLAAHQESGRVYVGLSSGLLSCTTSSGSLVTNINDTIGFVLIKNSHLFAVSHAVPENPRTLYHGELNTIGNLTLGAALSTNFYGNSVSLAIDPVSNKVYVLCDNQTNFVLLKSSDDYDAFSAATTFSVISVAGVTEQSISQVAVGPDGRLFLGGGSSTILVAYSDDDGGAWTNVDTSGLLSGGGSGLNIVCNGSSNAYEVYYGAAVSTNKGEDGSWIGLPRPGGYRPPSMHVNAGCTKVDPNNSQFIYVTTDKGIGGSTNAGLDVVELNNGLLAFQINDIDALSNKTIAWIASKAGVRIATNFNTTPVWTDGDFPDAIVFSCAIDSDDPSGMTGYAGSCRLYKTTTGGGTNDSSWVQLFNWTNYNLTDGEIKSVKANSSLVALGYYSYSLDSPSGGVFVSTDSGSNWTAVITNVDVNKLLIRNEGGAGIIYAAMSKSKAGDQGGIYRIGSSVDLDMTNEVNIRDMAEDSVGGIYASGTLPDALNPSRYGVVAYYRDAGSTWSMLTTNGLPGDFGSGEILGRDVGPVIVVGKDGAFNDVPVLASVRTLYYLPYGGSSWITVANYPNGTQIKTLFWDELMVGTTIGLYSQALNAESNASVEGDYDGDGKSDLAAYREGYWSIYSLVNGLILINGGVWGGSGWTTVPGDYDGDGKADLAVYTAGYWSIYSLVNGLILINGGAWGGADSIPVPGDYDGDGKADLAVYNAGYWSIYSLANGLILINGGAWGDADSIPVPGDYDGDGKADLAVYNAGYWSIYSLVNGLILINGGTWGDADSIPVPGDYDGDGKSDLAVYNAGYWSIYSLANGIILINGGAWGGSDSIPVPGDYDGDGKADLAVYNAGYWSIYSLVNGIILNNGGAWGGPDWTPVR